MFLTWYVSPILPRRVWAEISRNLLQAMRGVLESWLNGACICREETQGHVQGFPGAKFKKFKTLPEADQWYRSNLPHRPANPHPTATTRPISTVTHPNIASTSSSSTGPTRAPQNQLTTPVSRPAPQSISTVITAPAPAPVQPLRIAAPKNTTVDIVYSDGACRGNGRPEAVAGIGVWWGPHDPRYIFPLPPHLTGTHRVFLIRNLSERCPGAQTNNRAELIVCIRYLDVTCRLTHRRQ